MIHRDDLPPTPEWKLPATPEPEQLTIPSNIILGSE